MLASALVRKAGAMIRTHSRYVIIGAGIHGLLSQRGFRSQEGWRSQDLPDRGLLRLGLGQALNRLSINQLLYKL